MNSKKSGKKLIEMDAGKSLRKLMTDNNLSCKAFQKDIGVSATTVSLLREKRLMSGKNIEAMANYFNISCGDFLNKGVE